MEAGYNAVCMSRPERVSTHSCHSCPHTTLQMRRRRLGSTALTATTMAGSQERTPVRQVRDALPACHSSLLGVLAVTHSLRRAQSSRPDGARAS